jgi:hypothetical protein
VLHTAGNLYSNFDIWRHGLAEWQAPASANQAGDTSIATIALALAIVTIAMLWAYARLARTASATNRD